MLVQDNTPLAMLTVEQFLELLYSKESHLKPVEKTSDYTDKKYVYGLKGIRDTFKVSHATAQKYKDTILKEAIIQNGRKIIVDVDKALELFAVKGGKHER